MKQNNASFETWILPHYDANGNCIDVNMRTNIFTDEIGP